MILNTYTVTVLFAAVLTCILAVPLSVSAFRLSGRWGQGGSEERSDLENRAYLLLTVATAVLSIKLLSWPFLYVTLQSCIPDVPGAMCIFGVTRVQPVLSAVVQIVKPLVFFGIGGWLLLNRLDRQAETAPLFRRKFLVLSAVGLLAAMDSGLEFFYITGFKAGSFVACCTTYFDLPDRMTATVPAALLGLEAERYLMPVYYFSGLVFIACQAISWSRLRRAGNAVPLVALAAGAGVALLHAAAAVFAAFEVIAPRAMDLPLHHCIYCLWQYSLLSIVMTAAFIIGVFAPGWALILAMWGRGEGTLSVLRRYLRSLTLLGVAGISAAMAIATWYIL